MQLSDVVKYPYSYRYMATITAVTNTATSYSIFLFHCNMKPYEGYIKFPLKHLWFMKPLQTQFLVSVNKCGV